MNEYVTRKFDKVEAGCSCDDYVSIILKKPNGEVEIFLPMISEDKEQGVYGVYSAYSHSENRRLVFRKKNNHFINFEPKMNGTHILKFLTKNYEKELLTDL